jgi:hypothetical protein
MIEWFQIAVEPHWPFLMAMVAFMVVGQVMKGAIFTRERAYAQFVDQLPRQLSYMPGRERKLRKFRKMWWWAYKTMPLHPMAAGILLGMCIPEPEPGIVGPEASLYFATAGACSVFLYQVIKGFAKRRNIELPPLPGQSGAQALIPYSSPLPPPPKVPQALLDEMAHDERPTNPAKGK